MVSLSCIRVAGTLTIDDRPKILHILNLIEIGPLGRPDRFENFLPKPSENFRVHSEKVDSEGQARGSLCGYRESLSITTTAT